MTGWVLRKFSAAWTRLGQRRDLLLERVCYTTVPGHWRCERRAKRERSSCGRSVYRSPSTTRAAGVALMICAIVVAIVISRVNRVPPIYYYPLCPIGTSPDRGREAVDYFGKGHALSFAILAAVGRDAGDAERFPSAAGG